MTAPRQKRRLPGLFFAALVGMQIYFSSLEGVLVSAKDNDQGNDSSSESSAKTCTASYPSSLEPFSLSILPKEQLTLRLLQQSSFEWTPQSSDQVPDDTGMSIWGASVCLGRYLAKEVLPTAFDNFSKSGNTNSSLTILELGSGATGIPSMVACHFASEYQEQLKNKKVRVIATDQEERALNSIKHISCLNGCSHLESRELFWGEDHNANTDEQKELQADILLASEVIYDHTTVAPLVETIDRYLKPKGRVHMALRRDRAGVFVFTQRAMQKAGFCLIEQKSCELYQDRYQMKHDKDALNHEGLPPGFQNGGGIRWEGDGANILYVYERAQESSCLEEFLLSVLPEEQMNLKLQQQSGFDWSERSNLEDDTGMVVWGASVCLGRYLAQDVLPTVLNDASKSGKSLTILELGCGAAVPSLVACRLANDYQTEQTNLVRVIASDQTERTLQHVGRVAALNGCPNLELQSLPWGKDRSSGNSNSTSGEKEVQADILLASEVIYSHASVPSLVETIDRYLKPHGTAYIALRRDRPGVHTFTDQAMKQAGLRLLESKNCEPYQDGYQQKHDKDVLNHEELPPGFQLLRGHRWWDAPNYLYVFERVPGKG